MPSEIAAVIARAQAQIAARDSDPDVRAAYERREAEAKAAWEASQRAEQDRCRREVRRRSGMPPRVSSLLDGERSATDAGRAVEKFMGDPGLTFLVLAGAVGCGKTVAACAALDSGGGRFVKAAAVTRARFDDDEWETLLRSRVLVVDDLGTEPLDSKGWAAGALAELFDYRYDWQAKTILTTNLDAEAFKARYCEQDGGRFLSRLREVGTFEAISQASLRPVRQP